MQIVVTGANGFIGQNLCVRLSEVAGHIVVPLTRSSTDGDFDNALASADFVYHLAGANRPTDPTEFMAVNRDYTSRLCRTLEARRRRVPIAYASSAQARFDNPYGQSKLAGETAVEAFASRTGSFASEAKALFAGKQAISFRQKN